MPKTHVWPYEVYSQNEKGINFKQVSLTIDDANPAKDGVSKAGNKLFTYFDVDQSNHMGGDQYRSARDSWEIK